MDTRAGHPRPYHVVPGPGAPNRILLISYHAPPSNEVGAMRWVGMARHFATRGWGFDVITVDPSGLQNRNESSLERLPPGTRLFGVPDTLPAFDRLVNALARARQRIRQRTGGGPPSAQQGPGMAASIRPSSGRRALNAFHAWREYTVAGGWAARAAEAGRQIFDPSLHHWIISSGPPHMSHEGGRRLAVSTGLPFIADFRDAWRFQEWVPLGPMWQRLAARYESRTVMRSTLTVTNAEPVRALMQRAYPMARIVTITNGIDDDAVPPPSDRHRFIIGYPGTIYVGRDPAPLFEAVGEFLRSRQLTPAEFGIEFMGYSGPEVEARLRLVAAVHGVEPFLTIRQGGPRPRALEFMATCSVLLALQQGSDLAVPAKVFEYMRFPAWILVLAGARSATAELLEGTGADVLEPDDLPGIRTAIAGRFEEFSRGLTPVPLAHQERFTRRYQAHLLLEAMAGTDPAPVSRR